MQEQCICLQTGTQKSLFSHFTCNQQDVFSSIRNLAIWKPVSWHTFYAKKRCTTPIKAGGNFTGMSARKDLLVAGSRGLILEGFSVELDVLD